jgi:hypothetical protein
MSVRKQKDQNENADSKKEILRYLSMTGLMVPILLLSIVFVKLVMGDLQPRAVTQAIQKDKTNFARRLNLAFYLLANRDTRIVADETDKHTVYNLRSINGSFDLKGIHQVALTLKQKYPEVFRAIVSVTDKISQKEIKKVLERIRKRDKADPQIYLVDEKSGKKILLKVMFTDIEFVSAEAEG